jgi:hypothetical protein
MENLYMSGDSAELVSPRRRKIGRSGEISKDGRSALLEASREEIRRLVESEQFDVRQLASIGFLAENMRSLLADLTVQLKEEAGQIEESLTPQQAGPSGEYPSAYSLASANGAETFGASVLRELVPLLASRASSKGSERPTSLGELVEAAEVARVSGNEQLHKRILLAIERKIDGLPAPCIGADASDGLPSRKEPESEVVST